MSAAPVFDEGPDDIFGRVRAEIEALIAAGATEKHDIVDEIIDTLDDDDDLRCLARAWIADAAWSRLRVRQIRIEHDALVAADAPRLARIEDERRWQALKRGAKWAWSTITDAEQERWDKYREFEDQLEAESRAKTQASIDALIEQVRADERVVFTRELLTSEFALGDGRRVTWGQATIADHEARIALQTKNAMAVVADAALHSSAVHALKEHGVDCLDDLEERSP